MDTIYLYLQSWFINKKMDKNYVKIILKNFVLLYNYL